MISFHGFFHCRFMHQFHPFLHSFIPLAHHMFISHMFISLWSFSIKFSDRGLLFAWLIDGLVSRLGEMISRKLKRFEISGSICRYVEESSFASTDDK